MFSQRELAPTEDQGFFFGIVQAAPNATLDQTKLFTDAIHDVYHALPEHDSIFQITFPNGGFGGMTTKPWSERSKTTQQLVMETMGPLSKIPGIRVIPIVPPPLPGGGDFPVDVVIASAAEPQRLAEFAGQLVQKAFASGLFIFADTDVKFDQPQVEVVFDRDKLRSQGVDLRQAGLDLSTLMGGNYVNRFSIQGRSYKVIPQLKRDERLTADQLAADVHHRVGRSTGSTLDVRYSANDHRTARAEEVPAAQRRAHSGRHPAAGSARSGAELPGDRKPVPLCPRASPSTTPASHGSSGRRAAAFSACSCCRRC